MTVCRGLHELSSAPELSSSSQYLDTDEWPFLVALAGGVRASNPLGLGVEWVPSAALRCARR